MFKYAWILSIGIFLSMKLQASADFYEKDLIHVAAEKGDYKTVEKCLQHGVDLWGPVRADSVGPGGYTPLMYVVSQITSTEDLEKLQGLYQVARLLLQHGADPNHTTEDGISPFYIACKDLVYDLVILFLEHGADPSRVLRDFRGEAHANGWTLLHYVASHVHFWDPSQWHQNTAVLRALLRANPDLVWQLDNQGNSALDIALRAGNWPAYEVLSQAMSTGILGWIARYASGLSTVIPFQAFGFITVGAFFQIERQKHGF